MIKRYISHRLDRLSTFAVDDRIISPEKDNLIIQMKTNALKFTEQSCDYSLSQFHLLMQSSNPVKRKRKSIKKAI